MNTNTKTKFQKSMMLLLLLIVFIGLSVSVVADDTPTPAPDPAAEAAAKVTVPSLPDPIPGSTAVVAAGATTVPQPVLPQAPTGPVTQEMYNSFVERVTTVVNQIGVALGFTAPVAEVDIEEADAVEAAAPTGEDEVDAVTVADPGAEPAGPTAPQAWDGSSHSFTSGSSSFSVTREGDNRYTIGNTHPRYGGYEVSFSIVDGVSTMTLTNPDAPGGTRGDSIPITDIGSLPADMQPMVQSMLDNEYAIDGSAGGAPSSAGTDAPGGDTEGDASTTAAAREAQSEDTKTIWGEGVDTKQVLYGQVEAAGGWINWATGGPFQSTFMTLGASWFDEEYAYGGEKYDIGRFMTINHMAESICDDRYLLQDNMLGFITSSSGQTYAHMEGESTYIDPCGGFLYNTSCTPYYGYRISGVINAAELEMIVRIYLIADDGEQYNLYEDDDGKVTIEAGKYLSLSGGNMFYFESYEVFEKVCMQFYETDSYGTVFGGVFDTWTDGDTVCQNLVENEPRDYQDFDDEEGASSIPSLSPTPVSPSTPGGTDADDELPGLRG